MRYGLEGKEDREKFSVVDGDVIREADTAADVKTWDKNASTGFLILNGTISKNGEVGRKVVELRGQACIQHYRSWEVRAIRREEVKNTKCETGLRARRKCCKPRKKDWGTIQLKEQVFGKSHLGAVPESPWQMLKGRSTRYTKCNRNEVRV